MTGTFTALAFRIAGTLLIPLALAWPATPLFAQEAAAAREDEDDDAYVGEGPERYAQVRILEGEASIFKGELQEELTRGTPIAEGDVVESRGRGVLQLADGTRLAFGPGTRFQVAALFTDRKGDRQILLRLDHGRLRVAVGSYSEAVVRIDTPAGTATFGERAVANLEVERDQSIRLRVATGRVRFSNERDKTTVQAGERLTAYGPQDSLDRVHGVSSYESDAFDSWAERAMGVRRTQSWDYVPSEIRYYTDDLDENGEWVEVEDAGWCWRPRVTASDWRPYWRGRWGAYAGGMTWVSDEPWGYVTHHYGRWGWSGRWGWYWIPGRYYSPAWVAWHHQDSYFGWAPLGYYNHPVSWGFGAWGGGLCWNIININLFHQRNIHHHVHHDPRVIRAFTGNTTWSPGRRDIRRPWRQGPLMVAHGELRDPARIIRALDPGVGRTRLREYSRTAQQATGRQVILRERPRTGPADPGRPGLERPPFEVREPRRPNERPILRDGPTPRPVEPGRPGREVPPTEIREPRRPILREDPEPRPRDPVRPNERPGLRQDPEPRPRDSVRPLERPPVNVPRGWNEPRREPAPERPREIRNGEPRPSERPPSPPREVEAPRSRPSEAPRERPAPQAERPSSPPPASSRPSSPPSSPPPSSGDRGGSRRR